MNIKEKEYILEYYGEFYNEECGKWNTSLKSKWYDYKINEYFEEHFKKIDKKAIIMPQTYKPNKEFLEWHRDCIFEK